MTALAHPGDLQVTRLWLPPFVLGATGGRRVQLWWYIPVAVAISNGMLTEALGRRGSDLTHLEHTLL